MIRNAALRVTKNTLALFGSKGLAVVLSFAFVVYVARFLGVDGFGKYSLARSYFELFLGLAASAVGIVLTRDVAQAPAAINRLTSAALALVAALAALALFVLIGTARLFPYAADTQVAIAVAAVALLPAAAAQALESVFVALERAEYVIYGTVAENAARIGLSLLALAWGADLAALFVILVAVRIGLLALYGGFLRRLVPDFRWDFAWPDLRRLVATWRVFAAENWLSALFASLDVILISAFFGEVAVGLYSAADKFLVLGGTLSVSFTTALFPYLSRLYTRSRERFQAVVAALLRAIFVLSLPVAIAVTLLAGPLVNWLFGAEYAAAEPVLQLLIWVLVGRCLNLLLSYVLFARGQQGRSLAVAALSLGFFVPAALALTARWASVGMAGALLLATGVAFVAYVLCAFTGPERRVVLADLGRVLPAAAALALLTLGWRALWPGVWPGLELVPAGGAYALLVLVALAPAERAMVWQAGPALYSQLSQVARRRLAGVKR